MSDGKGDPVKELAAAVGRIPSGLFVVTVRNGDRETGLLASWVQQCSFEPFQVSVAVKAGADEPSKAEIPYQPGGSFINESM